MSSFSERNDRKRRSSDRKPFSGDNSTSKSAPAPSKAAIQAKTPARAPRSRTSVNPDGWIWGLHPIEAALQNPNRPGPLRLVASEDRLHSVEKWLRGRDDVRAERMESADIGRMLPPGAVHQGLALRGPALEDTPILDLADAALRNAPPGCRPLLLMLDQVTDPQNVGSAFRSAAAFGAGGLILQDRHAPELQGALAKAAAGAIDKVPFSRVTNLSRALETLADSGWRAVGLAGEAHLSLAEALSADQSPLVLVLGSEGDGMRRLVAEHCDTLARIPMPGGFESLNVSNACAIALYEALGRG